MIEYGFVSPGDDEFDARIGAHPSDFCLRSTSLCFALRADGFAIVQIRSKRI